MRSTFPSIEAISSKGLLEYIHLNAVAVEGLRVYPPAGAAYLSRIIPKGGVRFRKLYPRSGTSGPRPFSSIPIYFLSFFSLDGLTKDDSPPMFVSFCSQLTSSN